MAEKTEFGFYVVEQQNIDGILKTLNNEHRICYEISDRELENAGLIKTGRDYGVIMKNVNSFDGYDLHIRKNLGLIFDNCDLDNNDRIYIETTNDITINNCSLGNLIIEKNHQREINIYNSYIEYLTINESVLRRVKIDNSIIDSLEITHSVLPYGLHINYESSIGTFKLFESLIDNTPVANYNHNAERNVNPEKLYEENLEDIVRDKFILSNSLLIENNIDTDEYPTTDEYLNKNRYEKSDGIFICGTYRNIKNKNK